MKGYQFWTLWVGVCGSAFLGMVLGTRALAPTAAFAQVPPPVVENQQVVPNAGLRFVDEQGRVIAIISRQNGNGALTLLDSDGRPSIALQAAPNGRIAISALDGGGELRLNGQQGSAGIAISSTSRGRTLSITGPNGAKLFDLNCAQRDTTLTLSEAGGKKGLDLRAGQFGGEVSVANNLQNPVAVLQSTEEGGSLALSSPKKDGLLSAVGAGSVAYREKGKKVWQFPPTE